MPNPSLQALRQLAGHYGIQTAYYDATRRRQLAAPESLLRVLAVLGAPVATLTDVPAALRSYRRNWWQRGIEPVQTVWAGTAAQVTFHLPAALVTGPLRCTLRLESGDIQDWEAPLIRVPTVSETAVEGNPYVTKQLALPTALPWGYHHLGLETAGRCFETLLLAAPRQAYAPLNAADARTWGVFLPLYALQTQHSWGSGDFSDLAALTDWVADAGGGVVATLPLLSAFLDIPYDPSPYVPASRLFWNEFYVDVTRAPGVQTCAPAQALLASSAVQETLRQLRTAAQVDYRRQMALKRQILEILAHDFFVTQSEQHPDFQAYTAAHPMLMDYAAFRAVGERQGASWEHWPAPQRDGVLRAADYDTAAQRYHVYVQWLAHTQLQHAATRGRQRGVHLYLDLPLGVHGQSYDVWREREIFVREVAGGAPPDSVFTKGQNWGFPPLHPEAMRRQQYRYYIAYLQHQLRHTGRLRIDHVMGLHRLFWIPYGYEARHGVYVRYAAEELYAILSIESHRHQVYVVGENLGTVPTYVNTAMARHRLQRMYVVQYELTPQALRRVPADAVASLNTHDMAPFAAYYQGLDITDLHDQGLLDAQGAAQGQQQRQELLQALHAFLQRYGQIPASAPAEVATVLPACLRWLSSSAAQVVLVNLEDLWLETQPQNFPGTYEERPNWQRKARYSLEALGDLPTIATILREVQQRRRHR
jgi:4-alpha-glucanotransferase